MHYLYVLKSVNYKRTYIGITSNISRRLGEHNAGTVRSTKFYRPYTLIHNEKYGTKTEARKRELELKNKGQKKEELFKKLKLA